jgi:hypothetical protein
MALKQIDFAYQTLFSELEQRCLDAEFDGTYPETGRFKKTKVKGREYWYFHERIEGKDKKRYVGPDSDPEIAKRVAAFKTIKDDFTARRRLVSTLVNGAGLPRPDDRSGDLIEVLWKAGLFRMRAVMVGSAAFSCYPGQIGMRLPASAMRTGDLDVAQFHNISVSIDDSLPPILDVLRTVDLSFREVPHQADGRFATKFVGSSGLTVEFLTPNYSKDEYLGKPAPMPALGGAAAQPLRFLDFLIANPVRSVLLHKGGVPVRVPAPERYAIHKLIVATRRHAGDRTELGYDAAVDFVSKREKDVRQASILVEALAIKRRHTDLASVWAEAWRRGPAWRDGLVKGRALMESGPRDILAAAVRDGCREIGQAAENIGFTDGVISSQGR